MIYTKSQHNQPLNFSTVRIGQSNFPGCKNFKLLDTVGSEVR